MSDRGAMSGIQRQKLPISGSFNQDDAVDGTVSFEKKAREICLINDDTETAVLTVGDIEINVLENEGFDDRFPEFIEFSVSGSTAWRAVIRSGRVE